MKNCKTSCVTGSELTDAQTFPTNGFLKKNFNASLKTIKDILKNEPPDKLIYAYTISTVIKSEDGKLKQTGCGPNIEGGLITLTTCMHMMRAWESDKRNWNDQWVAGISGINGHENSLFYLMRVKDVFESFFDLWHHLKENVRDIKSTDRNIFGDIYRPVDISIPKDNKHLANSYFSPVQNHIHNHKDHYEHDIQANYWGRYPFLLAGDPERSYIWNMPTIICSIRKEHRFRSKKIPLGSFLKSLEEIPGAK